MSVYVCKIWQIFFRGTQPFLRCKNLTDTNNLNKKIQKYEKGIELSMYRSYTYSSGFL